MLRIDDTIFSLDIIEKKFCCDIQKCHGTCCRYGDSGAPLTDEEERILDNIWPEVKPYLRAEGVETIEKCGTSTLDFENDLVTPLINNQECAYAVFDGEMLMCGIEKAWKDGKISFQKPVSCHLFPVRIKQFNGFRTANYEELTICSEAREKGCADGIYVYEFLKVPLIRVLGEQIYAELCFAAREFRDSVG